jgi:hypothetical protein
MADAYLRRWTESHPTLFGTALFVWCVVVVALDRWARLPILNGAAAFGVGVGINAFANWRLRERAGMTMLHLVGYLAMLAGIEIALLGFLRGAGLAPILW